MATIEKLIKAFEGLKVFQSGTSVLEDASKKKDPIVPSKKDKILHCNVVADCICAPNMRTIADFPKFLGIAMETFLMLTDDPESDVRMVADECINRTIKILLETNLGRLQVELYKELKKNGASRSLRAALWRFADMCHLIRPQKCRPYIVNLLPCIARICRREEEAVQDTLAVAMPKICTALMPFANDTEVKALLKSFLPNLNSSSAVCRRMSASSLALICQHSRAPMSFFNYLINVLLEMLLPVDIDHEVYTLLGVLLCLRHSIPSLAAPDAKDQGLKDSFGFRESESEQGIGEEQVIKIIQALLHYSGHRDHNVVTASLEALQQLLRTPPPDLLRLLLTPGALSKSLIFAADALEEDQARIESAVDLTSMSDDAGLDEDMDLVVKAGGGTSSSVSSDSSAFVSDFDANSVEGQKSQDGNNRGDPVDLSFNENKDKLVVTDGTDYSGIEIAEISEERSEMSATSAGMSHSDSVETLQSVRSLSPFSAGQAQLPGHDMNGNPQLPVTESETVIPPPSPNPSLNEAIEQMMPDSLKEDGVPLLFYMRLLCKRFLLTGVTEGLVPDKVVRVSLKSLALGCVSSCLAICPKLFLFKLCPTASGAAQWQRLLNMKHLLPFIEKSKHPHCDSKQTSERVDLFKQLQRKIVILSTNLDLNGNDQNLQDVTLYAFHQDHQLKGQTALVIGQFLKSALSEGRGNFNQWVMENLPSKQSVMSLQDLLKTIIHILKDESAVATRAALVALQSCFPPLLESCHGRQGLRILIDLLKVKSNPYWLVKVELLELLSGLNFKSIHYLESVSPDIARGDHNFLGKLCIQEHYLDEIVFPMLGDEDARVRTAASNAMWRLVPKLYYASDSPQQDPVLAVAADETERLLNPIMYPVMGELPPLVHGLVKPYSFDILEEITMSTESALSRIIQLLLQKLQIPQSRYMTNGGIHALCKLSEEFLVTQYATSWNCSPAKPIVASEKEERPGMRRPPSRSLSQSSMEEVTSACGSGPLPVVMALMLSSPAGLEMTTLQDLMQLAGNLVAGLLYRNLRSSEETDRLSATGDDSTWLAISDRMLVPIVEQLFTHTVRLLNACTHAIEETTPGPPQVKPSLPSLPNASTLSPVRRKVKGDKETNSPQASPAAADNKASPKTAGKDAKEPEKDKNKKDGLGAFYNLPHMMRLFEILRGSYSNYKTSLDLSSSDKFCTILRSTLTVLSQLLEVATLQDIGKVTEELLGYLKVTMALEPTWTVLTVQQLLKALFGTNLASQWDPNCQSTSSFTTDLSVRVTAGSTPGLYYHCLNKPYAQLAHCLVGAACKATLPADEAHSSLVWLKQRVDRKIPAILKPSRNVDKSVIGWYIRLFEPLVIKALKQYTVSSSLELQAQVLALIAQLIQLRVNYCLLDSDQIFIGFVLKQFEFIEEGQIRNSELLIPYIFHFLVMLSYEKFHSKSIIDMPRIIHRCDGIMASGLLPTTHAIPALKPVVYDLFLMRGTVKSEVSKDLETQREVVVSMLLRLVQYYQALDMLVLVLQQCHRESEERWKRLSRQVIDIVLPSLAKHQINLRNQESLDVLHRLFESVAPIVFRPVDLLLKTLLAPPHDVSDLPNLQKWLCLVLTIIRVLVSQSKEEVILSRLQELQLHVTLIRDHNSPDQMTSSNSVLELLRNLAPEETLAWFLLQVIGKCSELLDKETAVVAPLGSDGKGQVYDFLLQQTLHLLLYVTHMFQSGLFRKVATAAMRLLQLESPACMYSVRQINEHMMGVSSVCPTLTLHWCNVLILLNFDDRSLWSQIVQTPPSFKIIGKEGHSQSTEENESVGCHSQRLSQSCGTEMLRRGGLILFCDYVCENLSDAEHMTWLIINHVSELILLSQESPVQDFIGAIQRNPAASSLFIQAIHARGDSISKPSMIKRTLKCLEGIHTSQSGSLIALLIDKFLSCHQLAVTRMTDSITCHRLEILLGESPEERTKQLPKEDIEKLLQFLKSHGLIQRHQRLASLLSKLCTACGSTMQMKLSPERSHPLALEPVDVSNLTIDKEFFMSVVKEQCFKRSPNCRECAFLLQRLDYPDILSVTMTKEFCLNILEECISLGAFKTILRYNRDTESGSVNSPPASSGELSVDPLFQASHMTMFMHISNVVSQLPTPHQCLVFTACAPASSLHYMDHLEELVTEPHWTETNFALAAALVRYMKALQRFPWKGNQLPAEYQKEVARFAVLLTEMVHWSIHHYSLPQSELLQTCLTCISLLLQNQAMHNLMGLPENASLVCTVIASLYQLLASMAVLPGERMAPQLREEHKDEVEDDDEVSLASCLNRACDQISEMVHCLQTRLDLDNWDEPRLPAFLASTFRNTVIGLSRLPVVNSYARTPPLVWRLGWAPSPGGDLHTSLPPLPVEYLQEKDVLKEFVTRINFLGWVNRQQFEESWMSLLGVLNPVSHMGHQLSPEEDMEQAQGMVIAVKAITSLLLQSSLVPTSGNPANGTYEIRPRDKPLAFLHTRCGKKLFVIRGLIEQEITSLCTSKSDHASFLGQNGSASDRSSQGLFEGNLERELGCESFSLGQISIESTWSLIGLLDINLEESDTTDSMESTSGGQTTGTNASANSPTSLSNSSSQSGTTRSVTQSGLDVHSCLQFLLELYGAWLHVDNSPKPPLMLLNSVVKSMVCLSDLFMEREQFEFMQDMLLDLLKAHPVEDELLIQYLVVGFCKATAVLGTEPAINERVVKLVESGLKSTHLPTKIAALHGCLYLFEGGIGELNSSILTILTEFLAKHLAIVSQACIISQQFVITMWATAFYVIENYSSEIKDSEFVSKIMQLVVHTASSSEENVSSTVFLVVLKGTERLLLTDVLTQSDRETIIKLSMDRLCLPNPQRALAALGLMFTCMYSGKSLDQYSPRPREEQTFGEPGFELLHQDPDSLILAMERVTVLFDRIKKGYPYEARVITRLLPAFLADFFPAQDIMNKVIGEFLSAHQPYPHLIAKVVFQVFTNLHQQQQQSLVKEWVMLSLSNFTQRSPLAMAVWSLTLFFISASTNVWLRALFPHVLGRMGSMDIVDRQLFCLCAQDFYQQLTDEAHKRAFTSTFQGIATADSPYADLIRSIS